MAAFTLLCALRPAGALHAYSPALGREPAPQTCGVQRYRELEIRAVTFTHSRCKLLTSDSKAVGICLHAADALGAVGAWTCVVRLILVLPAGTEAR